MKLPENPHRRQRFDEFLDSLVGDRSGVPLVAALREQPADRFYYNMRWHAVEPILAPYLNVLEALQGFAFMKWDPQFAPFSPCNLKAQYIPDEEFVSGGRAFVLFNLVASSWTHISQVSNQAVYWKRKNP